MKKYFTALLQSFYKPEIYRDAIVNWQGFGGKYLAFLSLLLALVMAANLAFLIFQFQQKELPFIVKQIPAMEIKDGIITVQGKQPVIIQSRNQSLKLTIDTTKSENELRQTKTQMGIGKDYLFVTDYQGNDKSFDLTKLKGTFKVTQRSLYRLWDKNVPLVQAISIPLLWLGQFIDMIVECLIVAVLSYMVTAFMTEEYDFLTRMRLAVLAVTPAEILTVVMKVGFNHMAQPWLVFLLACLYIYVMIILMRRLPPVTVPVTADSHL